MSDVYYDAGGSGSNTSPYDTPAKAATTLAVALAAVNASDDIIYVLSTSSQAISTSTFTASATHAPVSKPQKLYSVSSLATPTTLTYGATLTQSISGDDVILSGSWDVKGLHFDLGTGTAAGVLNLGVTNVQATILLENCKCTTSTYSGVAGGVYIGYTGGSVAKPPNITLKDFTHYSKSTMPIFQLGATVTTIDGLILSGTTAPTSLFKFQNPAISKLILKNSDLTGVAWTNLFDVTGTNVVYDVSVIDCKMPDSYTLSIGTTSSEISAITLINATSDDVNYQYAKYMLAGSIITIGSIYATTDPIQIGGVSVSDIFTSTASCGRGCTLSREYLVEVADNTAVTPFVELLVQTSGASALNNNEVYITAEAITVAGTTQGSQVTSHPGALATPSACSAGTTAYTGDGYATERTHRIETAAITTRQAGLVKITVHLAKASTALYVGSVGVV